MAKLHFRPYIPNQTVLFPQRIDENIAADDPVRIVNAFFFNESSGWSEIERFRIV
ncbi:hypothetical protein ACIXIR_05890 [Bacteroides fragilis]